MEPTDRQRIDLWLKLVCLVKHRADATEACKGGHVRINGQGAKPATPVKAGDRVELTIGAVHRQFLVQAIPSGNVSKEVARTMYVDETPKQEQPDLASVRERGAGRPTKKQRREMDKWKR